MLKKVLLGALVVGFAGVLVAGAIDRTATRTARVAEAQAQSRGGQGNGGSQGQGRSNGQAGSTAQPRAAGGVGGAAQGYGEQDHAYSDGGAAALEWLTETGTAAGVDASALTLTTAGGAPIIIDGRAWSFAQAEGYTVQPGDTVTVTGFYEDGEFKVATMENATNGQTILLRDETGRPAWSGQGNRAGGGYRGGQ